MCRRPVAARATRSAWKVASLPVSVSSTCSTDGTSATIRSASSTSIRVTPMPIRPTRCAAAATAASTSGSLWPSSGGPNAAW